VSPRGRPPRKVTAESEAARLARLARAAEAGRRAADERRDLLADLSPSARAGLEARAARLANA
jgi:hypothetical protein